MTIRLYVDEDAMDQDLVRALRGRGVDVTTALEAGMIARDDRDHLEYATRQGRALYSFNVVKGNQQYRVGGRRDARWRIGVRLRPIQ